MARPPRHFAPGSVYHVLCRGNRKQTIFTSERDHRRFRDLMVESVSRFDYRIVAFCLMPNHVHLAVQIGEVSLSQIFQNLLSRYAQWFNAKYQQVGHVFQGRFKSHHADSLGYLKGLIRYIHLNPVKAGLVNLPEQFEWSSHRAYVGEEELEWVSKDIGWQCFGGSDVNGLQSYRYFINSRIGGAEDFELDRDRQECDLDALLQAVAERHQIKLQELQGACRSYVSAQARAVAATIAKRLGGVSLRDLSKYVGQTPSTLSKAAARVEIQLGHKPELRKLVAEIQSSLAQ